MKTWDPAEWQEFARDAPPESIEDHIRQAAREITVAELWHRRLTALLVTRYRQIQDGEWPQLRDESVGVPPER